eukprot:scaffold191361_cov18-Prasinocladus_malaysianus.AAC.1
MHFEESHPVPTACRRADLIPARQNGPEKFSKFTTALSLRNFGIWTVHWQPSKSASEASHGVKSAMGCKPFKGVTCYRQVADATYKLNVVFRVYRSTRNSVVDK